MRVAVTGSALLGVILGPQSNGTAGMNGSAARCTACVVSARVGSGMVLNMEHSCVEIKERIHEIVLGEKPPPNLSSPFQVFTQPQHRTLMHPVLYTHA